MKEKKEIILVGLDIHCMVKGLCNQFLGDHSDMRDGENEAYRLGINNTLSLLNQVLTEFIPGDIDQHYYDAIGVNIAGIEGMEDFLSIEEVQEKINKINEDM